MTFCRSFNACVEIEAVFGHGVTCPLLRSSGPVVSCRRGSGFTPHSEELSEARLIEEPLIFRPRPPQVFRNRSGSAVVRRSILCARRHRQSELSLERWWRKGKSTATARTPTPPPLTRCEAGFGGFEVQSDSFAIDEHEACFDQLLAGRIKIRVSAQKLKRDDELDSQGTSVGAGIRCQPSRGAEVDAIKVAAIFEKGEDGADEMGMCWSKARAADLYANPQRSREMS